MDGDSARPMIFLLAAVLCLGVSVTHNAKAAIPVATGSGVSTLPDPQGPFFDITNYGAVSNGSALVNQAAINNAIAAAAAAGGGTIVIPAGDFKTYSIRLQSNVGLHFSSSHSIIRAAVPGTGANQDGGFYDAPEVNLFVGLEDEGHAHWKNSLIWGIGVSNVMLSGPGLIDGSSVPNASGVVTNVIPSSDPGEVTTRTAAGTPGNANKAIALENSTNIIFRDFSIKNGGHFGIIVSGVQNLTVDGITVDGNRDAFDVDTTQDCTVRNSWFNAPNDDALVLKGSFGIGRFYSTKNVLLQNNIVSGYDAGSVLAGIYATNSPVPNGRIKLGTEGTSGFDTITFQNTTILHSRGIALESVDGADLMNVIVDGVTMRDIFTDAIFIRLGDRGRTPVTGNSSSQVVSPPNNVRLDDTLFILPNLTDAYGSYPPARYIPSYSENNSVTIGGGSRITIVNPTTPTRVNPNSPVSATDPLSANAVGPGQNGGIATVHDILITNVAATDVDPQAGIDLYGLVGHPVQNVTLSNISVQFRGGLSLQDAVEQRQLNTTFSVAKYQQNKANVSLPWLTNTSAVNETLLPRISWDPTLNAGAGGWADDPYNIPESPRTYPEALSFGIPPAYGMYARHVSGLTVSNVSLTFEVDEQRPAVVLDDVNNATFQNFSATVDPSAPLFVEVTDNFKRDPVREYVTNYPYQATTVSNVALPPGVMPQQVIINRPEPGTPPDALYALPTAPSTTHPYSYAVANASYPLPLTVYRPFFNPIPAQNGQEATPLSFTVSALDPAIGVDPGQTITLSYSDNNQPPGASFNPTTQTFSWTPQYGQAGVYTMQFIVNDGVLPVVSPNVVLTIAARVRGDVNGDGVVTCQDLVAASAAVGQRTGQAGFLPAADMDGNGLIDIRDIAAISRLLPAGTHC